MFTMARRRKSTRPGKARQRSIPRRATKRRINAASKPQHLLKAAVTMKRTKTVTPQRARIRAALSKSGHLDLDHPTLHPSPRSPSHPDPGIRRRTQGDRHHGQSGRRGNCSLGGKFVECFIEDDLPHAARGATECVTEIELCYLALLSSHISHNSYSHTHKSGMGMRVI